MATVEQSFTDNINKGFILKPQYISDNKYRTIHIANAFDSSPVRVETPQFEIPMDGPFVSYTNYGSGTKMQNGM